jgi:hypothetical protein
MINFDRDLVQNDFFYVSEGVCYTTSSYLKRA